MAATLALAGPASSSQRVAGADIGSAVRTAMALRLRTSGNAADVRLAGRIADQWLPKGQLTIEPGEVSGRLPRSRVGVPVNFNVDGRLVRSMTVWVAMEQVRQVMTYAGSYRAGQVGGSMQWTPASIDMTCCAGAIASSDEQVADLRLTRGVRAGQPVMLADFEPVPDVQARQPVTIEVRRGPVRLQTRGIALRDGNVGDRLAVRPDHSGVSVSARVVSRQKVVVDE